MKRSLLLLALFAAAVGCTPKSIKPITVDPNGILNEKGINPEEKAEKLAQAGETLMGAESFMHAQEVLDIALRLDPKNKRAQFYNVLNGIQMNAKGSLKRIKPLVDRNEKSAAEYAKALTNLKSETIKGFLLDGPEDIKNEKDLQKHIDGYTAAADRLRKWLKENKDLKLSVTVNPRDFTFGKDWMVAVESCAWKKADASNGTGYNPDSNTYYPYYYTYSSDNFASCARERTTYNINQADIEAMQNIAAGIQIYYTVYNAYSLSGSADVAIEYEGMNASNQKVVSALMKQSEFGKIRDSKALNSILYMGIDALAGAKWVKSIQDSVCAAGKEKDSNRPGYLFSSGLCVKSGDANTDKTLQTVEAAILGQAILMKFGSGSQSMETEVNPSVAIMQPIDDLKSLKPEVNDCGHVTSVTDGTLGGTFVKGDFNNVLKVSLGSCEGKRSPRIKDFPFGFRL